MCNSKLHLRTLKHQKIFHRGRDTPLLRPLPYDGSPNNVQPHLLAWNSFLRLWLQTFGETGGEVNVVEDLEQYVMVRNVTK